MLPDQAATDSAPEAAYRWTIRGLYLALLAANLYVVWDMYRDTPQAIELRAEVKRRLEAAQNCEGCARRKEWLGRQINRVIFQATEIVEEAAAAGAEDGGAGGTA